MEVKDKPATTSAAERTKFLLRNLLKGILWLTILVTAYILAKKYLNFNLEEWLGPLYDSPVLIFSIFLGSEIIFGIIPPELFMFWALRNEDLIVYLGNIVALSIMSYIAGVTGYYIGSYFNTTKIYRLLRRNYLGRYERLFNQYGGFLVIVASLTPLPFSAICMLVGAVKYNFRKFVWFSLFRFLRFLVYSIIIWEANVLN